MIISVDEAKNLANVAGWNDSKIMMRLKAIEQTIRAYTNNNFQARGFRTVASIRGGVFTLSTPGLFKAGDTIQISNSKRNDGVFTVCDPLSPVGDDEMAVVEPVVDEECVLVTKVVYPADVVACAVNLLEWEVNNRAKVGIQSETLSRHSVSYFNMDSANQVMGYPAALLGALKPYRKARC